MKIHSLLLLVIGLAFTSPVFSQTQIVTLSTNGGQVHLAVAPNQIVTLLYANYPTNQYGNTGCTLYLTNGLGFVPQPLSGIYSSGLMTLTGVTNIVVSGYAGTAVATFSITTPSSQNYVPASTVVIPTDANGPVQIILESSSDLVNWSAASPGTYGNTYSNRFFRVRAVAQ